MHSKRIFQVFASLLVLLQLCACSLSVSEPAKVNSAVNLGAQGGCLSNAGDVLKNYFSGNISATDLDSFWNCIDHAFTLFIQDTSGKNVGYDTPQELKSFMEKFFLNNKPINQGFMDEAMFLKQAIMGGATDRVTADELRHVVEILRVFREQTELLRPYMPLSYDAIKAENIDEDHFEEAITVLHGATSKIGAALQNSVGTYTFDHLDNLLKQLGIFLYGQNDTTTQGESWLESAKQYAQILRYAKSILISPPADAIQKDDWQKIFYLAPRQYTTILRFSYYFGKGSSINYLSYGQGLQRIRILAKEIKSLLESAVKNHTEGYISFSELNLLTDTLDKYKLLPAPAAAIKPLFPLLFNKLFKTDDSPTANPDLGINQKTIDKIWADFTFWDEGQSYLEGLFKSLSGDKDFLTQSFSREQLGAVTPEEGVEWTGLKNEVSLQAIKEVQHDIVQINTIFPGDSNVVSVAVGVNNNQYSFQHLTKINFFRNLSEIILQGIATDPARATHANPSISKDEINDMFAAVFPLGVALNALDPSSKNVAASRFVETTLFTYAAKGTDFMGLDEAIEEESLLLSTELQARKVHQAITAACSSKERNSRGQLLVDSACYRKTFAANAADYWSYIPGFANYFTSLKPEQQANLFNLFDSFIRTGEKTSAPYDSSATQGYILVPYYIEIIFAKYDKNNSGTLDNAEGEMAYPTFEHYLGLKAATYGLNNEKDWHALFTYLLQNGKLPNESTLAEVCYGWERYMPSFMVNDSYNADRNRIVVLFSKILQ